MQRYPDCPETLNDEQLNHYREQGYLAFEKVLLPEEVEQARQDLRSLLDRYVGQPDTSDFKPAIGNGDGPAWFAREGRCLIQCEAGTEADTSDLDALELRVRKYMNFDKETPLFRDLATTHPRVAGLVSQILGEDVEIYQSMALVKGPGGREKPWHQDNAYFAVRSLDGMCGVWIALEEATPENGCMHVLPGGHRGGPLRHCHRSDCEIVEGRIDTSGARPVPLGPGGALFFHSNLPHQTPPNRSNQRRRALQMHFRARSNQIVSPEEFAGIFVEADGTPASCNAATR